MWTFTALSVRLSCGLSVLRLSRVLQPTPTKAISRPDTIRVEA
eukprot:COSAG02_NODE_42322_length_385_cov_1.251748_1_plen_42_part_01